jgi:hypothetical protein
MFSVFSASSVSSVPSVARDFDHMFREGGDHDHMEVHEMRQYREQ